MTDHTLVTLADLVRSVARVPAETPLRSDSRLIEDIGIDSLDLVGIVLKVQDTYGVLIDEDDVPGIATLGQLAEYIHQRRGDTGAAAA